MENRVSLKEFTDLHLCLIVEMPQEKLDQKKSTRKMYMESQIQVLNNLASLQNSYIYIQMQPLNRTRAKEKE